MVASVLWFRHGLRLHDNPALLKALELKTPFYPVYIFDGESSGTSTIGFNRMQFLIESLQDLDNQLKSFGSQLFVFRGSPLKIFHRFWQELGMKRLCFEQDCEPIWKNRDNSVKSFCKQYDIQCFECVSHTLWDPFAIVEANGGTPPLTYEMFLHVASTIGDPSTPVSDAIWSEVVFGEIFQELAQELQLLPKIPTPQDFGTYPEKLECDRMIRWIGGETQALHNLRKRLNIEETAFREGSYLPNQANPDLIGPPTSQSAALRHGCLSIRLFYWSIHDLFQKVHGDFLPFSPHISGQLIWREYFYTMSVNNPFYAEMERNEICINIPWSTDKRSQENLEIWKNGKTGFPFIDAVMRQLLLEGWVHHYARNAAACFLTRGVLWISWEEGLKHFLKYLLDADWSVCAGNWMWVSSSAFEQLLDCSTCVCPVTFGCRLNPEGEYIRRYVPELRNMPIKYLHEPWCAPLEVQERANCIIGKDYPSRIVNHKQAAAYNQCQMQNLRTSLIEKPAHCCPSNEDETRQFMWLLDSCKAHSQLELLEDQNNLTV